MRTIEKIDQIFKSPSNNIVIQLVRYLLVGGTAFVVDFAFLAILTEYINIPYLLSACLSFAAGLIVNYLMSIKWVFNKSERSDSVFDFILFSAVGILGLGLNAIIIWFFTEIFASHYMISKLASTGIVFCWNFLARRAIIGHEYLRNKLIPTHK